jgi:hypothetical protein
VVEHSTTDPEIKGSNLARKNGEKKVNPLPLVYRPGGKLREAKNIQEFK